MIYVIYDFDKMRLTTEKYKQIIGTLNVAKEFCIESFNIQSVTMNYDIHINKTKITCVGSPSDNRCFISTIQAFVDNDSRLNFKSSQCVLCTIENPRAGKSPAEQDPCRLPSLPDAVIHYSVSLDSVAIFAPTSKERVFNSDSIVSQFISRIANDDSVITGDMNFLENFVLNSDFWQHVFDIRDVDRFENLIRALRISMVGLFYDKCGDTPDEVLNCDWFKDLFHTASRKDTVLADIIQHFTQLKNEEGFKRGPCSYLNSKKQFNDEPYRGHCGYLNPDLSLNMSREKRLVNPATDPIKPPKWLTHLYTNQVENDGELPDKAKICDLLYYMIDYVASWSDCCDAHSSQQMKDVLPLLVRCKNILKEKK